MQKLVKKKIKNKDAHKKSRRIVKIPEFRGHSDFPLTYLDETYSSDCSINCRRRGKIKHSTGSIIQKQSNKLAGGARKKKAQNKKKEKRGA